MACARYVVSPPPYMTESPEPVLHLTHQNEKVSRQLADDVMSTCET